MEDSSASCFWNIFKETEVFWELLNDEVTPIVCALCIYFPVSVPYSPFFMQLNSSKIMFCSGMHEYILYVSTYDICIHTHGFMGLNSQNSAIAFSRIILAILMPLDSWHTLEGDAPWQHRPDAMMLCVSVHRSSCISQSFYHGRITILILHLKAQTTYPTCSSEWYFSIRPFTVCSQIRFFRQVFPSDPAVYI